MYHGLHNSSRLEFSSLHLCRLQVETNTIFIHISRVYPKNILPNCQHSHSSSPDRHNNASLHYQYTNIFNLRIHHSHTNSFAVSSTRGQRRGQVETLQTKRVYQTIHSQGKEIHVSYKPYAYSTVLAHHNIPLVALERLEPKEQGPILPINVCPLTSFSIPCTPIYFLWEIWPSRTKRTRHRGPEKLEIFKITKFSPLLRQDPQGAITQKQRHKNTLKSCVVSIHIRI